MRRSPTLHLVRMVALMEDVMEDVMVGVMEGCSASQKLKETGKFL